MLANVHLVPVQCLHSEAARTKLIDPLLFVQNETGRPDELEPFSQLRRERIGVSQQLSLRQALTQIDDPVVCDGWHGTSPLVISRKVELSLRFAQGSRWVSPVSQILPVRGLHRLGARDRRSSGQRPRLHRLRERTGAGQGMTLYASITAAPATITSGFDIPSPITTSITPALQITQHAA